VVDFLDLFEEDDFLALPDEGVKQDSLLFQKRKLVDPNLLVEEVNRLAQEGRNPTTPKDAPVRGGWTAQQEFNYFLDCYNAGKLDYEAKVLAYGLLCKMRANYHTLQLNDRRTGIIINATPDGGYVEVFLYAEDERITFNMATGEAIGAQFTHLTIKGKGIDREWLSAGLRS